MCCGAGLSRGLRVGYGVVAEAVEASFVGTIDGLALMMILRAERSDTPDFIGGD